MIPFGPSTDILVVVPKAYPIRTSRPMDVSHFPENLRSFDKKLSLLVTRARSSCRLSYVWGRG